MDQPPPGFIGPFLERRASQATQLTTEARPHCARRPLRSSHNGGLHTMDWRKRFEEALPSLAAVAAHPELSGGGPEIERGRLQVVDVQRVAQHGEIALLLGQSLRQLLP